MNGFERHGIKHSSPSALNMWADCPAAWAARYLFDKKFSFGVAPQIGLLVEKVCEWVLMGDRTFDQAVTEAKKIFAKDNALNTNVKDTERIDDIEPMAALALKELELYGKPEYVEKITGREQQRVELKCNGAGWSLPVIGFLDFVYPEHGIVVDLKTTLRIPSSMTDSHKRQGAVYAKSSGNKQVRFLYVSPKKALFHDIENVDDMLADVKNILIRQEKMLALHDKETLRQILPVNTASYFWNGCENIRKELYGI